MNAHARMPIDKRRRSLIGKVHVAKKELGLDETLYRDLLFRITGHSSAANCSDEQLITLVDEFKRQGWQAKPKTGPSKATPKRADHKTARKARALWISLWYLGAVESSTEAALEAFAKRQLGTDRLQWADQTQMFKVIEALKAMALREGWDPVGTLPQIKTRLLAVILGKLKAKEYAVASWTLREAAARIAHFEHHLDPMFWDLGDLDMVAAAFGRLLRTGQKN